MKLTAERLMVEDSPEAISELFYRRGWTDGLPIIPPTPDRVERMLAAWDVDPSRLLGRVPPSNADATVEKLAISAVMAGCLPAHLPALAATVEAMLDPKFNLNGVQCTTSSTTPLLLFNGPVRRRLEINCGANAFGPGSRANAALGRAVRFVLMAIGGAVSGEVDKAALGQPGKFAFCFGENEEQSPWEPYHVEKGFREDESTVAVFPSIGIIEVVDYTSTSAEGVMKTMAHSMTSAASVAANHGGEGGEALLVLTPEHAEIIHGGGFSKAVANAWIWEEARMPLRDFTAETAAHLLAMPHLRGTPPDGTVHVTRRPEDIVILVAGGEGCKSAFIPTWGALSRSAIRPIY